MKLQTLIFLWLCTTCLAAVGCRPSSRAPEGSERPLQKVATFSAVEEQVTEYVDLVGRTTAFERVDIRSRVSGFLLKTHFQDGQRVSAGDLLFSIEPDSYQAIYNQAEAEVDVARAKLDLSEKTFTRSQDLIASAAISKAEFDENQSAVAEAHAALIAAEANAARVKLDVDYTAIKSPISGRVDRARLDDGNYVTGGLVGGTTLTTVINDVPIKAVADVDENLRLKFMRRQREAADGQFVEPDKLIELNIPCFLQLPDEEDFPHEGLLEYAQIDVDVQTGTSQIRAVFDNSDSLLNVGMFVRLRVPVSAPYSAVLVPDTAIGTDQATKYVYVVDSSNEIQQRPVEIGDLRRNMRVVKSGLEPSESVVVAGLQLIQQGMKVDPQMVTPD